MYLELLEDCNQEWLQRVHGEEDEVFNTDWSQSARPIIAKINHLRKEFPKAIVRKIYFQHIVKFRLYLINGLFLLR